MFQSDLNLKRDEEYIDFIEKATKKYGFSLKEFQILQQLEFLKILYIENQKYNLTSIVKFEEMIYKHILDSLLVLKTFEIEQIESFLDVGAGAGFPSIPLIIVKNFKKSVLIDASRKRVEFLKLVNKKLGLNFDVLHARAEQIANGLEYREKFKIVTARAVAKLNVLVELCLPFVELNGYFIALKGPEYLEDLQKAEKSINILGGFIEKVENFQIEDNKRNIILIKKISHTSTKYPRTFAKISKTPL